MCFSLVSILFWDLSMRLPVLSFLVICIFCCVNGHTVAPQCVHSRICWWTFGLLPGSTVMSRAAMNIHVQMFLKTYVSSSLGYKPRIEMATPQCMHVLSILATKNSQKIVQEICWRFTNYIENLEPGWSSYPGPHLVSGSLSMNHLSPGGHSFN